MENSITSRKLFATLEHYRSCPFVAVEPGGNYGDDLIHQGAKKLFGLAGIKYKGVKHREFMALDIPEGAVVYINGSGSFNDIWDEQPIDEFMRAVQSPAKAVIVGPSTFTENVEFFKNRVFSKVGVGEKEVFIFCRERVSYAALSGIMPPNFKLLLDHDTSLNLVPEDIVKPVPAGGYTLYAIRTDKEKSDFQKPDFLSLWVDPIPFCASFKDWVALHASANRVVTNRLHSSILSSILGKPVTLLPNSYHKNQSVWEYSLKDRGVLWEECLQRPAVITFLLKFSPYRVFVNSYKVSKFVERLILTPKTLAMSRH